MENKIKRLQRVKLLSALFTAALCESTDKVKCLVENRIYSSEEAVEVSIFDNAMEGNSCVFVKTIYFGDDVDDDFFMENYNECAEEFGKHFPDVTLTVIKKEVSYDC